MWLIISASFLIFSCENKESNTDNQIKTLPLVDITNPSETVAFLCDLFQQMNQDGISDADYKQIQIQIEAIYLGIEFSVNVGFYSNDDLLLESETIDCLI